MRARLRNNTKRIHYYCEILICDVSQFRPGTIPEAADLLLLDGFMIWFPAWLIGLYLSWCGTGIGGLSVPVKMLY